jgi:hypothetical protein
MWVFLDEAAVTEEASGNEVGDQGAKLLQSLTKSVERDCSSTQTN